jgi:hypothetical protein
MGRFVTASYQGTASAVPIRLGRIWALAPVCSGPKSHLFCKVFGTTKQFAEKLLIALGSGSAGLQASVKVLYL